MQSPHHKQAPISVAQLPVLRATEARGANILKKARHSCASGTPYLANAIRPSLEANRLRRINFAHFKKTLAYQSIPSRAGAAGSAGTSGALLDPETGPRDR